MSECEQLGFAHDGAASRWRENELEWQQKVNAAEHELLSKESAWREGQAEAAREAERKRLAAEVAEKEMLLRLERQRQAAAEREAELEQSAAAQRARWEEQEAELRRDAETQRAAAARQVKEACEALRHLTSRPPSPQPSSASRGRRAPRWSASESSSECNQKQSGEAALERL